MVLPQTNKANVNVNVNINTNINSRHSGVQSTEYMLFTVTTRLRDSNSSSRCDSTIPRFHDSTILLRTGVPLPNVACVCEAPQSLFPFFFFCHWVELDLKKLQLTIYIVLAHLLVYLPTCLPICPCVCVRPSVSVYLCPSVSARLMTCPYQSVGA